MAENIDYLFGGGQTPSGIGVPQESPQQYKPLDPPKTPEEKQQRLSAWERFVQELKTNQALQLGLIQMGTAMMQPMPAWQTPAGHVGTALQGGVNTLMKTKQQQAKTTMENRKQGFSEKKGEAEIGKLGSEQALNEAKIKWGPKKGEGKAPAAKVQEFQDVIRRLKSVYPGRPDSFYVDAAMERVYPDKSGDSDLKALLEASLIFGTAEVGGAAQQLRGEKPPSAYEKLQKYEAPTSVERITPDPAAERDWQKLMEANQNPPPGSLRYQKAIEVMKSRHPTWKP
jgi:hypothetical protein